MLGVILNLGSDGSFPQFPSPGTIDGIYGPMEERVAKKLMKEKHGVLVPGQTDEWTVGECDGLGRTVCRVRFVFVALSSLENLIEEIRHMKSH